MTPWLHRLCAITLLAASNLLLGNARGTDLVLDPYLGYLYGGFNQDRSGSLLGITQTPLEGKIRGYLVGTRAGLQIFDVLFIGPDIDYGVLKVKQKDTGAETDYTHLGLGLTALAKIPSLPLRFWLSYVFLDQFKEGTTEDTLRGSGLKAGLGYLVLPYLSINLEYWRHVLVERQFKSGNYQSFPLITLGGKQEPYVSNTAVVSVSFPLSFPLGGGTSRVSEEEEEGEIGDAPPPISPSKRRKGRAPRGAY